MDIRSSHRAQLIKPSPTMAVTARAAAMREAGRNILSLAAGEPDFATPAHVNAAAIEAINNGATKYTNVDGTGELKNAVIAKFKRDNNLHYEANEILISCGCKHSIYNLMQAVLNDGDEVIIPSPYWVSYPDMARLAGAEPVTIRTSIEQGFKISADQLRGAISEKTRLLVLNSPSNPTGTYYDEVELQALAAVLLEHPDILIASDDIYEHILWGGQRFVNIVNARPELGARTVVLNGVSKAYAMTGWRIGYAAGAESLIAAMKKIQSQSTSNPPSVSQSAAVAALNGDQSALSEQCNEYEQRHNFLVTRLNTIDGIVAMKSAGTFYSFPNVQQLIDARDDINTDIELAEMLLERAEVALVPGTAFGAPGHLRLSYATSLSVLEPAMRQIEAALRA